MLSLSLLAARSRLLHSPVTARCASVVAHSVGNNVAVVPTLVDRLQVSKSRVFSTFDGPKDEDKDDDALDVQEEQNQPIDGELSPLECLIQHSQHFRLDMDDDNDKDHDSEQGDDDDVDDNDPFASFWQTKSSNTNSSSRRTLGAFKRNTFRRRGNSVRHSELGKMAVNHLVEKDADEINYDAELENVWDEEELKLRKFHQALRREEDRDQVCTNCGERGHRARNCLVPRICSNCGNLGHTARQCRYRRNPDSIDEFLMQGEDIQQKRKKSWKLRKKAAKAAKDPDMPRPKEVPTSDFNKRNESLRKELDAELDAYVDMLEEKARKHREQKKQKEAQRENSTPSSEN